MTYEDIISQIARRLGYQGYDGMMKSDIRTALKQAEAEMVHYIDLLKRSSLLTMDGTLVQWALPTGFCHPASVRFIDTNSNELQAVEVQIEEYLRWNPNPQIPPTANDFLPQTFATDQTIDNARLGNKIVWCIQWADIVGSSPLTQEWFIFAKPAVAGTIEVLYYPDSNIDPFDTLTYSPPFPDRYHYYLVNGAVRLLAEIEAGQANARGDMERARYFMTLSKQNQVDWKSLKEETRETASTRVKMPFLRGDAWYDNPRKYR
jgi:hypothetical protein